MLARCDQVLFAGSKMSEVGDPTVLLLNPPTTTSLPSGSVAWPAQKILSKAAATGVTGFPRELPSSRNCTLATPMLSLALAETVAFPETVAPLAGESIITDGGTVSGLELTGVAMSD